MSILEKISVPADLKKLSYPEIDRLCSEIRNIMVEVVSKNGGHLASNLGAVELSVALHRVFDLSRDRFIFDVGHQCYAHKILTGRLNKIETLRQYGGLSGFPKLNESVYDAFGTGHSSTSISAAAGYAAGRDLNGENYYVGAIIGDASLSSGMAFEALNHIGHMKRKLMIILNDNEMAISPNVGALSVYLEKIRVGWVYNKVKEDIEALLKMIPIFGSNVAKFVERVKSSLKYLVVPGMIFEELGIKYIGPIDGHNVEQIVATIENAKDFPGPVLIHAVTKKGKGFSLAEASPEKYHSGGLFCMESGAVKESVNDKTYTDIFSDTLADLAARENKIVAITAAMCDGTGLASFAAAHKDRFFDVGICEQHAFTFAAGLSLTGKIPVVALYSTFSQRAFDQFVHDIALQNLHVIICLDRAGLVGEDGPTHHGAFDISMFKMIPNAIIMAPSDAHELKNALYNAVYNYNQPVIIRYPKGKAADFSPEKPLAGVDGYHYENIERGMYKIVAPGEKTVIISCGTALGECVSAEAELREKHSLSCAIIDLRFAKPISDQLIEDIGKKFSGVVCVEDNALKGGVGEEITARLYTAGYASKKIKLIGLPDRFVEHGANAILRSIIGNDRAAIVEAVLSVSGSGEKCQKKE
ncbi:MAG: 1-deoxy-D-xylulose-5-phosphate synthase [Candidatus Wallbacteria bacterium GWC2_49_35]|uniref:1-deoxy-D-xylulose-5-phosphate synthase n=1 Tax=Candidatus Wallbacteria bacterium GWC2_49_35 TaxID=1817813 RepID=A0A1F7WY77_9BACT|nr:MAG: 1-deoxy-D-xylulose-5-phosphate synthase [Candidatus Wallbacteria bacterium GWC2_49_35]